MLYTTYQDVDFSYTLVLHGSTHTMSQDGKEQTSVETLRETVEEVTGKKLDQKRSGIGFIY